MTDSVRAKPSVVATIVKETGNAAKGALGLEEKRSTVGGAIGDVAAAAIPGVGQLKAVADIFDGVKKGDYLQAAFGVIGLIPIAGSAGTALKATKTAATKAVTQVGEQVAKQGLKATALHHAQIAARTTMKAANDPVVRKQAGEALARAFGRATEHLQTRLVAGAEEGKPVVEATAHDDFLSARNAMAKALDVLSPDGRVDLKGWHAIFAEGAEGKREIVGKHLAAPDPNEAGELVSTKGFRFVRPSEVPKDAKATYGIVSWVSEGETPKARVDTFPATAEEAAAIFDAYLKQASAFRSVKKTA